MGKKLLIAVVFAVIAAVASHFVQDLLTGDPKTAVSAGVAGVVAAVTMMGGKKKSS